MKRWTDWFSTLDGSVADAGNPFGESRTIGASGVKDVPDGNISNGYGIFEAESLKTATALLKGCPILSEGGRCTYSTSWPCNDTGSRRGFVRPREAPQPEACGQGARLRLRERPVPSNRATLFINSSWRRAYGIRPR